MRNPTQKLKVKCAAWTRTSRVLLAVTLVALGLLPGPLGLADPPMPKGVTLADIPKKAETPLETARVYVVGSQGGKPIEAIPTWLVVDTTGLKDDVARKVVDSFSCQGVKSNSTQLQRLLCGCTVYGSAFGWKADKHGKKYLALLAIERECFQRMAWYDGAGSSAARLTYTVSWGVFRFLSHCKDFFAKGECDQADPPITFYGVDAR